MHIPLKAFNRGYENQHPQIIFNTAISITPMRWSEANSIIRYFVLMPICLEWAWAYTCLFPRPFRWQYKCGRQCCHDDSLTSPRLMGRGLGWSSPPLGCGNSLTLPSDHHSSLPVLISTPQQCPDAPSFPLFPLCIHLPSFHPTLHSQPHSTTGTTGQTDTYYAHRHCSLNI